MNSFFKKSVVGLLCIIAAACSSPAVHKSESFAKIRVEQPSPNAHVQLLANVYEDELRSLRMSGTARNTAGNPLTAGHVHAVVRNSQDQVIVDQRFNFTRNAGAARLQRGSKKAFGGNLVAAAPADYTVEVFYHTGAH